MLLHYPVELVLDDNDTVMLSFPDIPGAYSFGDDEGQALSNGVAALETAMSALIADRKDIPAPSETRGTHSVAPTLLGCLKIYVYLAMRARGWRKADLARSLRLNARQIDRLLDLRHRSSVAQLEQALKACGQRIEVIMEELEAA